MASGGPHCRVSRFSVWDCGRLRELPPGGLHRPRATDRPRARWKSGYEHRESGAHWPVRGFSGSEPVQQRDSRHQLHDPPTLRLQARAAAQGDDNLSGRVLAALSTARPPRLLRRIRHCGLLGNWHRGELGPTPGTLAMSVPIHEPERNYWERSRQRTGQDPLICAHAAEGKC